MRRSAISRIVRGSAARSLAVDLDDPDLVRLGGQQVADRRVLREQPVPVDAAGLVDRAEQGGDRGGRQHRVRGDLAVPAVEGLELAGHHIDGAEQQLRRLGIDRDGGEGGEVDGLRQQSAQVVKRQFGGRDVVRAELRCADEVGQLAGPHDIELFINCSAGLDAELAAQNGPAPAGAGRLAADELRPGEHGADGAARGAAQTDHPVPGQHVVGEQPAENACGESGVAAAALAGDGHPGPVVLRHHGTPRSGDVDHGPASASVDGRAPRCRRCGCQPSQRLRDRCRRGPSAARR